MGSACSCWSGWARQRAGEAFGQRVRDLYWPVDLTHKAIYFCFAVSLTYTFLWGSRLSQAQCGKFRIMGNSFTNCSIEVVGLLIYMTMTWLSLKLIWYYENDEGKRVDQLKKSFDSSCLGLLTTLAKAKKTINNLLSLADSLQEKGDSSDVKHALWMLSFCKRKKSQFSDVDLLQEKMVEHLADLYPVEQSDTEEIDEIKNKLRILTLNTEDTKKCEKEIHQEIKDKWKEYKEPKSEAFNECRETERMRVQSLSKRGELDSVADLVKNHGWRIVQLYKQKDEDVFEEEFNDEDNEKAKEDSEFLMERVTMCVQEHLPIALESGSTMTLHVLMSSSKTVKDDAEMLPQWAWETPSCCLPRFSWCPTCLRRVWRSSIIEQVEPLSSTGGSQYRVRTCSLGFCKVALAFPLQEQLLFALVFATLLLIFNFISVISGFVRGCSSHLALPCGQMLFQRIVSILCTFIYVMSVIHCLKKENFKKLEPMVTMYEMVDELKELAHSAQVFKNSLTTVDELCKTVKASLEKRRGRSELVSNFLDEKQNFESLESPATVTKMQELINKFNKFGTVEESMQRCG